jgi:hypothetical protein
MMWALRGLSWLMLSILLVSVEHVQAWGSEIRQ